MSPSCARGQYCRPGRLKFGDEVWADVRKRVPAVVVDPNTCVLVGFDSMFGLSFCKGGDFSQAGQWPVARSGWLLRPTPQASGHALANSAGQWARSTVTVMAVRYPPPHPPLGQSPTVADLSGPLRRRFPPLPARVSMLTKDMPF